jgi:hypothetical protein
MMVLNIDLIVDPCTLKPFDIAVLNFLKKELFKEPESFHNSISQ